MVTVPSAWSSSSYTGTRSMPIGDFPGSGEVNDGSIGARQ